MFVEVFTGN